MNIGIHANKTIFSFPRELHQTGAQSITDIREKMIIIVRGRQVSRAESTGPGIQTQHHSREGRDGGGQEGGHEIPMHSNRRTAPGRGATHNQVARGSREKKGKLLVAEKRTGVRRILRGETINTLSTKFLKENDSPVWKIN